MANYYIVPSGYSGPVPAGYTTISPSYDALYVTSGVRVASGDNVIVSSSWSGNLNIITRSGTETPVNVAIEGGSTGSQTVSFPNYGSSWSVKPTITVADGVNAANTTINGARTDSMTVNVGDGARLGNITGGTGGTDVNTITTGVGSTVGNITGGGAADTITVNGTAGTISSGGGNDTITIGSSGTVGAINTGAGNNTVTINGTAGAITTEGGDNHLVYGDGARSGNVTFGDGSDSITAGDNVTTGAIALGSGGANGDHISFGDNATVNGDITQDIGDHDSNIVFGSNTTINGAFTLRGGHDYLTIGDNSSISGLIDTGSVLSSRDDDRLTIGHNVTLGGGFQTEAGADIVSIGVNPTFVVNKADGYTNLDGSDRLILTVEREREAAFREALAAQGWTDDNGDGIYDGDGAGFDFTWGDVTYTEFEKLEFIIYCFVRGTLIETVKGAVAVEDLAEGDLVLTRDNGPQPIRWIGAQQFSPATLRANEKLRPIRIRAGALAAGIPSADLLVSPQHRVLVRSKIAERMFGASEVLVAAKQLCAVDGIEIAEDMEGVEYFHFLFDRHEVVISNGAETESLFTGPQALKAVGPEALEEIFTIFPELAHRDYTPEPARPLATGRMARRLAERHLRNNRPLIA